MPEFIPPNPRLKVYGASKLFYKDLWKKLYLEWPEIWFTNRWPWVHCGTFPDEAEFARRFWCEDLEDVKSADVVMVYSGSTTDVLRGALVEAGMGLALGKRVVVVGSNDGFSTWQYHPMVTRVADLAEARQVLYAMAGLYVTEELSKELMEQLANAEPGKVIKVTHAEMDRLLGSETII